MRSGFIAPRFCPAALIAACENASAVESSIPSIFPATECAVTYAGSKVLTADVVIMFVTEKQVDCRPVGTPILTMRASSLLSHLSALGENA